MNAVNRRRSDSAATGGGVVVRTGSVWDSRMKLDEVKGGIKVFNGADQDNSQETSSDNATTPRIRLKRVHQTLDSNRKTWNSDTISKKSCKELSVSVDGINKNSLRSVRRVRSSEDSSPVGMRKTKIESVKSVGGDLGKDEKNVVGQLRKVKSESSKGNEPSCNALQLRKVKSDKAAASFDEFDEKIPVEEEEEEEIGESGSDENCKEFGVCKEMVISTNVDMVKSESTDHVGDDEEEEQEEEEDELEEEVDGEEFEVVEVEKTSLVDIKEVNASVQEEKLSKVVNEVKVVNQVKKFQFDRRSRNQETKKLHVHHKAETISVNLKKQSPVMSRVAAYSNVPKHTSYTASNDQYHSYPETHSKLQSLVDLIMWKDVSRSVFIFGIGTFVILSSSYMKDLNISFISVVSYMSLVYLAVKFLSRSIICRGAYEVENSNSVVGEEEAIWLLKLVLPYLNEFLLKFKALFSGDPATTIKLAVLLFVLGRCGSSITIWTMSKVGFFGVFTVPKVCSLYSTQIITYAQFWGRRLRDAWDSCTHKRAVTIAIFLLVWNLSSVGARIWAAFILVVAFRYYQQKMVAEEEEWMEEEGATPVDINITKQKKGF